MLESPFTIVVDTREQRPFEFRHVRSLADQGYQPIRVGWYIGHLKTGDYSIDGCTDLVCVERKSVADLVGSITGGHQRFRREHDRMAQMERGAGIVVVEGDFEEILLHKRSHAERVVGTYTSWLMKYGVPWVTMPTREWAELFTYRFLDKWWKHHHEKEVSV